MDEHYHELKKTQEENILLKDSLQEYKRFCDLASDICVSMSSILDVDKLIAFFVSKSAELFKVNKVSLMLLDEVKKELFMKSSQGLNPQASQARVKLGELFCGRVAKEGIPLVVKDVEAEFPGFPKDRLARYASKSFVIVPIKVKDGIIGVLSLTDQKEEQVFTDDDLTMLTLMSNYLALEIEKIRLLEKIKTLSTLDLVTNLYNHRYFHEQVLEEIYRAERYRRPLSLMMLDIDNFSDYNQNCGYSAGDDALKQIGKILNANTRQIDFVSRYGPEEFMVLLPETGLKEAVFVAEKIREKISEAIFAADRKTSYGMARLTVSVGVAEHKVGLRKEELIKRVTDALLEAKQQGKNRVCVFK